MSRKIMDITGAQGKAEDHFIVKIIPDPSYFKYWELENWEGYENKSYDELKVLFEEARANNDPRLGQNAPKHEMMLKIIPKSDTATDLAEKFSSLFTTEEIHD